MIIYEFCKYFKNIEYKILDFNAMLLIRNENNLEYSVLEYIIQISK